MTIITLTTDFGRRDNFVGVMKGVILGINPKARLVDLGHDLPAHDPAQGAFSLLTAYRYFPEGTIHTAVIDPGVGSGREVLALEAAGQTFIAPDNGLLSYVMDEASSFEARFIRNPSLTLSSVSSTFHGRDVMAPAAARLSLGFPFEEVGPEAAEPVRLPPLAARSSPEGLSGRVVYVDRFGNLITNVPNQTVQAWAEPIFTLGTLTIEGLSRSYASAEPGAHLALAGSSGFVEIARNMGRAEDPPELTVGTPVIVTRRT